MRFCTQCGNMYYIRITEDNGNALIYYCRNCGNEENVAETHIDNLCVSKTNIQSNKSPYRHIINEYTKLDPTLPRIKNMKCPNEKCPTHKTEKTEKTKEIEKTEETEAPKSEIIYLRYDDINMKFIYLCAECNTTWLSTSNK